MGDRIGRGIGEGRGGPEGGRVTETHDTERSVGGDRERSVAVGERIPAICDPDNGVSGEVMVPDPEVAVGGGRKAEEAEGEGSVCGDERVAIEERTG